MPTAFIGAVIQSGLGPILTPRMTRAVYREQASGKRFSTVNSDATSTLPGFNRISGTQTGLSYSTPTSRATPRWPRQSPRLLVTSKSITTSPPIRSGDSWFRPEKLKRSSRSASGMDKSTYFESQFQETSMTAQRQRRVRKRAGKAGAEFRSWECKSEGVKHAAHKTRRVIGCDQDS